MAVNNNIGASGSMVVYGNVDSFNKLISNHGQLCKIKQAMICPCVKKNAGQPSDLCELCYGDGYVYTYQRRFTVNDEDCVTDGNTIRPFWTPIKEVIRVQSMNHPEMGGIKNWIVESFDETTITTTEPMNPYEKKRVTYSFDGWTYVAKEKLRVDTVNKLMYADGTVFDSEYQSSNPLRATADIAQIVRVWNEDTGKNLNNYRILGSNIISTTQTIGENMYAEYYFADLSKVITADIITRKDNETTWNPDLTSGECRMSFYPYTELVRGDIITLPATVMYKNEQIQHRPNFDRLFEMEPYDISELVIDSDGKKYFLDTDYILAGRYIKWLSSNQPATGATISTRYGFKPSYVIFEDNPQPNNLENKQYPITVFAKSLSKINKNDVVNIMNGR